MNENTERMPLMPPSPLSTFDSAPAAAAVRPQLKIGARTTQDVRVRKDEVYRWHDYQWRRALDAVKESLVERTCEAAIEACEAGVAGVIDTLVTSATAEANAAAEQTRAQAKIEKAELQAEMTQRQSVIDGLQADLLVERDRLKRMRKQLDTEVAARVRSESERDEARRESLRVLSVAESEMERLRAESDAQKAELSLARQQLDAAMAERSKLMATFQLVQRALSLGTSGELEVEDAGRDGVLRPGPPQEVRIEKSSVIAPALAGLASPPVADTQVAVGEAHPEAVEDIKQVLEQVKAIYDLDVNSDRSSAELVDSLTTRLRQARDVIVARSSLSERDAIALFEEQIDVMLDLMAGTSFGRHLSISAYAARGSVTST
jgi:hypothetical protein